MLESTAFRGHIDSYLLCHWSEPIVISQSQHLLKFCPCSWSTSPKSLHIAESYRQCQASGKISDYQQWCQERVCPLCRFHQTNIDWQCQGTIHLFSMDKPVPWQTHASLSKHRRSNPLAGSWLHKSRPRLLERRLRFWCWQLGCYPRFSPSFLVAWQSSRKPSQLRAKISQCVSANLANNRIIIINYWV